MAKERLHDKKHGAYGEGYKRDPDRQEKERKTSKQSDPSKDNFTGISGSIATIMKQNAAMKKAAAKKVKKEEVETIDELKSTTLLSYSNKAANELAFKGDGGKKAQKRATGVKRAAGQLTMKAINKEEVVTELNRYGKETGKATGSINKRAGTPVKKGGNTSDKALLAVRGMIRRETGKPEGQRKKIKGEKGRSQYGDRRGTPADTIAKRRQAKADAERLMRDTSGT